MYCRSCRKWFPNNILFCDICGKPLVKDLDIYGENFFNGDVQAFDYIYQNSYNWVAGEVRKMFSANSSEVGGLCSGNLSSLISKNQIL